MDALERLVRDHEDKELYFLDCVGIPPPSEKHPKESAVLIYGKIDTPGDARTSEILTICLRETIRHRRDTGVSLVQMRIAPVREYLHLYQEGRTRQNILNWFVANPDSTIQMIPGEEHYCSDEIISLVDRSKTVAIPDFVTEVAIFLEADHTLKYYQPKYQKAYIQND